MARLGSLRGVRSSTSKKVPPRGAQRCIGYNRLGHKRVGAIAARSCLRAAIGSIPQPRDEKLRLRCGSSGLRFRKPRASNDGIRQDGLPQLPPTLRGVRVRGTKPREVVAFQGC
jgi:hypothetical protein